MNGSGSIYLHHRIRCAGNDLRLGRKAAALTDFPFRRGKDFLRPDDARQDGNVQPRQSTKCFRPFSRMLIQKQKSPRFNAVRYIIPGQPVAHIILHGQNFPDFPKLFRLISFQPYQLRQSPQRSRRIARDSFDFSAAVFFQFSGFLYSPLVRPVNCRPDNLILLIQEDGCMRGPIQGQRSNLGSVDARLFQKTADICQKRLQGILRILFRPPGMRIFCLILTGGFRDYASILPKQSCLGRSSAKITSNQIFHIILHGLIFTQAPLSTAKKYPSAPCPRVLPSLKSPEPAGIPPEVYRPLSARHLPSGLLP